MLLLRNGVFLLFFGISSKDLYIVIFFLGSFNYWKRFTLIIQFTQQHFYLPQLYLKILSMHVMSHLLVGTIRGWCGTLLISFLLVMLLCFYSLVPTKVITYYFFPLLLLFSSIFFHIIFSHHHFLFSIIFLTLNFSSLNSNLTLSFSITLFFIIT